MPRVHVVGGIDAARDVGRGGAKRLEDGRGMREERGIEEHGDRRARPQADERGLPRESRRPAVARPCRPGDHHASAHAASDAGSTITDVSLVAIARPAATPASAGHRVPPSVTARPSAIANASVKQANIDSWMYIRE